MNMVNSKAWDVILPLQSEGFGTLIPASAAASLISITVIWFNKRKKKMIMVQGSKSLQLLLAWWSSFSLI